MENIKAILVDDEKNGRENLRGVLNRHCPEVLIVGEAGSALNAINLIQKHKPDLIFLDIEMPGGNGFEILEYFKSPEFSVIFVTAYDHYAIQAIRFSALDYILKPINALKLKSAVNRFKEQREAIDSRIENFVKNNVSSIENKRIALPSADKIDFIEIKNIIKCKGETNYTRVFLSNGKEHLISKPLVEYEEILEGYGFIRTHKSHIVNKMHVTTFVRGDGGYLLMSDKTAVPISRRRKEFVLDELKKTGLL